MAGSGDWIAASVGDRSRLRVSDADRDRAVDELKAAFVQGRLAKDEFDLRVGQVLTALTYADLDAQTADVPAGLPRSTRPAPPVATAFAIIAQRARTWHRPAFILAGLLLMAAGILLPSVIAFICGLLVVGCFAPSATPGTPEAATVRTWQSLYRRDGSRR
jgi:DUF1707 SHOCT-like domain